MKFYPIPKFYPVVSAATMQQLDEEMAAFRKFAFVPLDIPWTASQRTVNGVIPQQGATCKPFRYNAALYKPGPFDFLVQRGEVNLRLRSSPSDAGTVTVDAENITELEGLYHRAAIAFYVERFLKSGGKEFARIPRLVRETASREEALRLNVVTPATVDVAWALGLFTGDAVVPNTLNPKLAFRFAANDRVEAFHVDEYNAENPIVAGSMSEEELVDTVQAILADSTMSVVEKARAIRLVAR